MSFRNLESDTLSDVKRMGKYWLNFVFLTSRGKNKTVYLRDTVHQTSFRESAVGADLWSAGRPLTPLGRSGGPYHVTTQFYYYLHDGHSYSGKTESFLINNPKKIKGIYTPECKTSTIWYSNKRYLIYWLMLPPMKSSVSNTSLEAIRAGRAPRTTGPYFSLLQRSILQLVCVPLASGSRLAAMVLLHMRWRMYPLLWSLSTIWRLAQMDSILSMGDVPPTTRMVAKGQACCMME